MNIFIPFLLAILSLPTILPAGGDPLSPAGLWKTFDEQTGRVNSIVRVWLENGELRGRIERIFPKAGEDSDPKCDPCTGDKKGLRVIGMTFLWGFRRRDAKWVDGYVLDARDGRVYRGQLQVTSDGRRMNLFGYVRIIFKIGRTATWERASVNELEIS